MPFYHRVYTPGQLQFITASTYRRTPFSSSIAFGQALSKALTRCVEFNLQEVPSGSQTPKDRSLRQPAVPLSTLRLPPRDDRRKTRGQDGVAAPFP